jgi:hypothetical protein
MKTFRITTWGEKYWVEVDDGDGACRVLKGFMTEYAALRYVRVMQKVVDRAELAET